MMITNDEIGLKYLTDTKRLDFVTEGKVVLDASCWKCDGSGFGPWHQDGGRCYACGGIDTSKRTQTFTIKQFAQKMKAKDKRAEKAIEKTRAAEVRKLEGQRKWCTDNGHGPITFSELDAKRLLERDAEKGLSEHFGTVKKRDTFQLVYIASPSWEGQYGTQYCHIFKTLDGNKAVWTTGKALGYFVKKKYIEGSEEPVSMDVEGDAQGAVLDYWIKPEKNDVLLIKATVKEHSERDGEKQTVLTRGVLVT